MTGPRCRCFSRGCSFLTSGSSPHHRGPIGRRSLRGCLCCGRLQARAPWSRHTPEPVRQPVRHSTARRRVKSYLQTLQRAASALHLPETPSWGQCTLWQAVYLRGNILARGPDQRSWQKFMPQGVPWGMHFVGRMLCLAGTVSTSSVHFLLS